MGVEEGQPSGASVASIERLYGQQAGRFRRLARALVTDREIARDVVQDAFASAVRARQTFRGQGELEGWLWRLVVNAALDELRRQSRTPVVPLRPEHHAVPNGTSEPVSRLAFAVSLLPERQRLAIFLHYYADLDYARIGEVLGISAGTVAASLHSARSALRDALETKEVEHDE